MKIQVSQSGQVIARISANVATINDSNSPALGKLTLTHGTIATVWATVAIPVGILLTTLERFVTTNTFDITQLIQASFTT